MLCCANVVLCYAMLWCNVMHETTKNESLEWNAPQLQRTIAHSLSFRRRYLNNALVVFAKLLDVVIENRSQRCGNTKRHFEIEILAAKRSLWKWPIEGVSARPSERSIRKWPALTASGPCQCLRRFATGLRLGWKSGKFNSRCQWLLIRGCRFHVHT